jgi:hypothetical protein
VRGPVCPVNIFFEGLLHHRRTDPHRQARQGGVEDRALVRAAVNIAHRLLRLGEVSSYVTRVFSPD